MRILSVELKKIKPEKTLRGFASCIIAGELNFKLTSMAIHCDNHRYWIVFPQIKTINGECFYAYVPLDKHTHLTIEKRVIEKYMKEVMENDIS